MAAPASRPGAKRLGATTRFARTEAIRSSFEGGGAIECAAAAASHPPPVNASLLTELTLAPAALCGAAHARPVAVVRPILATPPPPPPPPPPLLPPLPPRLAPPPPRPTCRKSPPGLCRYTASALPKGGGAAVRCRVLAHSEEITSSAIGCAGTAAAGLPCCGLRAECRRQPPPPPLPLQLLVLLPRRLSSSSSSANWTRVRRPPPSSPTVDDVASRLARRAAARVEPEPAAEPAADMASTVAAIGLVGTREGGP